MGEEKFDLRVLWGTFGPEVGQWYPNPSLEMSADEQRRQNQETMATYRKFVAAAGSFAGKD